MDCENFSLLYGKIAPDSSEKELTPEAEAGQPVSGLRLLPPVKSCLDQNCMMAEKEWRIGIGRPAVLPKPIRSGSWKRF